MSEDASGWDVDQGYTIEMQNKTTMVRILVDSSSKESTSEAPNYINSRRDTLKGMYTTTDNQFL
jgi:hypothetical protein